MGAYQASRRPGPTALSFVDSEHGWIADDTKLLATTDGGKTWVEQFTFTRMVIDLDFVSLSEGWAVNDEGVFQTQDGGETWTATRLPLPNGPQTAVDFADTKHGWVDSFATIDGGKTWQKWAPPCRDPWWSGGFSFASAQDGWMLCESEPGAGQQGKEIQRTTDGGAHWEVVTRTEFLEQEPPGKLPSEEYVGGIFFLDTQHGWVGIGRGRDGGHYATSDGGTTWQYDRRSTEPGILGHIQFLTPTQGYALSNPYSDSYETVVLLRTLDGGASWQQLFPAP